MDHTEARARLLAIYLAAGGLKEYKADWLKNANTVVRDTSGRFASKASDVKQAVEQKTASVKEDLTNVGRLGKVGIESIDLLRKDKDFRRRAGLASGMLMAKTVGKLTDNPQIEKHIEELSAEVTAEFSEAFGDDKSPFAQALRKSGKALPEGGSFKERLENAALVAEAYKDALKEPEDYNKFQEDLGNAARATIPVAVSIAIAVAPELLIPIVVEGTVDIGTVVSSLTLGQIADKVTQFGMDVAHVESPWARMGISVVSGIVAGNFVAKQFLDATKLLAREGTRSGAEIEKKMLPKLKKVLGGQKEKILSLKGAERDMAVLKSHGFDSVQSLDKKVSELTKRASELEGTKKNTKERVKVLKDLEELLALSNQTTTLRHAESLAADVDRAIEQAGKAVTEKATAAETKGNPVQKILENLFKKKKKTVDPSESLEVVESLSKSVSASRHILRAEEEFGADLDKVLLASNPEEMKAAHAALLKKMKRRKKTGTPQFSEEYIEGTQFSMPSELPQIVKKVLKPGKFSDEEKRVSQELADEFSEMFGVDSSKMVFVKHPTQGPSCSPTKDGKYQINIDQILSRSKLSMGTKRATFQEGRLPASLNIEENARSLIFHELCHTLEMEKRGLFDAAQEVIEQKKNRLYSQMSLSEELKTGFRKYENILERYGQESVATPAHRTWAQAQIYHQIAFEKMEHVSEFLSTAGEKLMDPKSLQVGLRNDREKILLLLSQVLE